MCPRRRLPAGPRWRPAGDLRQPAAYRRANRGAAAGDWWPLRLRAGPSREGFRALKTWFAKTYGTAAIGGAIAANCAGPGPRRPVAEAGLELLAPVALNVVASATGRPTPWLNARIVAGLRRRATSPPRSPDGRKAIPYN